jgi:hypothetical protein
VFTSCKLKIVDSACCLRDLRGIDEYDEFVKRFPGCITCSVEEFVVSGVLINGTSCLIELWLCAGCRE